MHTRIHAYMHTYIHIGKTHIHAYTYTRTYTPIHMHTTTGIDTYVTYTNAHTHTHTHTRANACTLTCARAPNATCMHAQWLGPALPVPRLLMRTSRSISRRTTSRQGDYVATLMIATM